MSRPLTFLRRHRRRVVVGVVVTVVVVMMVTDSQTRGYSHIRDILTSPLHLMQPLLLLPPENTNMSINMKYEGEDALTDILTRRLRDDACYDLACDGNFSPSPRERLRQVLATRRQIPQTFLQAMASATARIEPHKYMFVTGVSSNHYYEMQGLLRNLRTTVFHRLSNYTLVMFDLGLTAFERYVTEKNCLCTVVDFPFSELPEFVRHLTCYSWKPIAIASLIDRAEYLIWNDASIRWESQCPPEAIFERCRSRGFQNINSFGSIAVRTIDSLFQFHGDQQCQYAPFSEMLSGFEMFYNDRFTREAVLQPWLSCAYDQRCMCIRDHVWQFNCPDDPTRGYGRCHRYDQSGIGVIQSKLLLDQRPIIYLPRGCVTVAREVKLNWFEPRKVDVFAFVAGLYVVMNVLSCGIVFAFRCLREVGGGGGGGGGGGVGGCDGEFSFKSVRWRRVVIAILTVEAVILIFLLWVFV